MRYRVEKRGMPIFASDIRPDQAILSFVWALLAEPQGRDGTLAFSFVNYTDANPIIEGYRTADNGALDSVATCWGVTRVDWIMYGPPSSIELNKEELERRGIIDTPPGAGKTSAT